MLPDPLRWPGLSFQQEMEVGERLPAQQAIVARRSIGIPRMSALANFGSGSSQRQTAPVR